VEPRAGLDDVEKRKFLTLLGLELRAFVSLVNVSQFDKEGRAQDLL
jgi:hypothetical protein